MLISVLRRGSLTVVVLLLTAPAAAVEASTSPVPVPKPPAHHSSGRITQADIAYFTRWSARLGAANGKFADLMTALEQGCSAAKGVPQARTAWRQAIAAVGTGLSSAASGWNVLFKAAAALGGRDVFYRSAKGKLAVQQASARLEGAYLARGLEVRRLRDAATKLAAFRCSPAAELAAAATARLRARSVEALGLAELRRAVGLD
jgi:hypothetical protein